MEQARCVEVHSLGEFYMRHELLYSLRLLHDSNCKVVRVETLVDLNTIRYFDLDQTEFEVDQVELPGALILQFDRLDHNCLILQPSPLRAVDVRVVVPLARA